MYSVNPTSRCQEPPFLVYPKPFPLTKELLLDLTCVRLGVESLSSHVGVFPASVRRPHLLSPSKRRSLALPRLIDFNVQFSLFHVFRFQLFFFPVSLLCFQLAVCPAFLSFATWAPFWATTKYEYFPVPRLLNRLGPPPGFFLFHVFPILVDPPLSLPEAYGAAIVFFPLRLP